MRYMLRWWETLGRPERIVAMSLAVGGTVAVANSTVWAIAVCYMTHQKTKAAIAAAQHGTTVATSATVSPGRTAAFGNATDSVPPESGVVYAGS
ncbi:MAG: hypothetical protein ACXWQR_08235 [Ktedonobacterales bacterium]